MFNWQEPEFQIRTGNEAFNEWFHRICEVINFTLHPHKCDEFWIIFHVTSLITIKKDKYLKCTAVASNVGKAVHVYLDSTCRRHVKRNLFREELIHCN